MKKIKFMTLLTVATCMIAVGCDLKATETSADKNLEELDILILKNQYALNVKLFNSVLIDISEDESNRRIGDGVNSIKWIAGHVLDIQYNLAMLLGVKTENPYAQNFGYGKPFDPNGEYPELQGMLQDWNDLSSSIEHGIQGLSREKLDNASPFPIPYNEQTIRGLFAFQLHHLGYEIGQLALYRKYLGKSAMSYQ